VVFDGKVRNKTAATFVLVGNTEENISSVGETSVIEKVGMGVGDVCVWGIDA
jgi:hypothetical protein